MQSNKILVTSLLVILILTSTMSFFGQDSFSAYARNGYLKKTHPDHHTDSSSKIIKHKIKYHKTK